MSRLVLALAVFSAGCIAPGKLLGDQCDLTSECDAPLVCGLGRCRNECAATRDCPLGLRCVRASNELGVCLLEDETDCELNSHCPTSLACLMMQCTNECRDEDDCVAGARCHEGNCVELADERCVYPSNCPYPLTCLDGQCVAECRADEDCPAQASGQFSCFPHATCLDDMCMCRFSCVDDTDCPNPGTGCTPGGFCERTASAP